MKGVMLHAICWDWLFSLSIIPGDASKSLHINSLFSFITELYPIRMGVYLPVGTPRLFLVFAVMKKAAVNICV